MVLFFTMKPATIMTYGQEAESLISMPTKETERKGNATSFLKGNNLLCIEDLVTIGNWYKTKAIAKN